MVWPKWLSSINGPFLHVNRSRPEMVVYTNLNPSLRMRTLAAVYLCVWRVSAVSHWLKVQQGGAGDGLVHVTQMDHQQLCGTEAGGVKEIKNVRNTKGGIRTLVLLCSSYFMTRVILMLTGTNWLTGTLKIYLPGLERQQETLFFRFILEF